ncbi:MAG: hypothetical protein FJ088_15330, partial [Deltaproteobacteria bacterium]|nr:hypothetical protein [Deltaproteobacteria bacterium]
MIKEIFLSVILFCSLQGCICQETFSPCESDAVVDLQGDVQEQDVLLWGVEGGACYPNGTCNMGLVCSDDKKCVKCPSGTSGCPCKSNGKCEEGLSCVNDLCVEKRPIQDAPFLPGWDSKLSAACPVDENWSDVETPSQCNGFSPSFIKEKNPPAGSLHWDSGLDASDSGGSGKSVSGVRWCGGALIAENLFLTSANCLNRDKAMANGWLFPSDVIAPEDFCRDMHVDFNYQKQAETGEVYKIGGHEGTSYKCAAVAEIGLQGLDYALLILEGCPGKVYGTAAAGQEKVKPGDELLLF